MAWPWATALYGLVLSTRVPDAECGGKPTLPLALVQTRNFRFFTSFSIHRSPSHIRAFRGVRNTTQYVHGTHLSSETTGKTPYETDLFCFFFILYMTEDSDTFSSTFRI